MLKLQALFQLRNSASLYVFNLIINLMQFSSCVNVSQRFHAYSAQYLFWCQALLVGSSGLEPPTFRLSGGRSNQLSYEPIQSVISDPED